MKHDAPQEQTLGYIYILGTSICLSAHFHACSKMVQDVHPFTFAFWNSVVGTGVSVILMLIFESPVLLRSSFCIGLLVMHCLGVTSVSLATQWSLQYIRPAVCAIIYTLDLVIMIIFQYTFLKDIKLGFHNWVGNPGSCDLFLWDAWRATGRFYHTGLIIRYIVMYQYIFQVYTSKWWVFVRF